jgi:hypothetical protein
MKKDRVRMVLHVDPRFYELSMKARPYSKLLKRIEFVSSEFIPSIDGEFGGFGSSRVIILVPRDLYDYWESMDDGFDAFSAAEIKIQLEHCRVCERHKLVPIEELSSYD